MEGSYLPSRGTAGLPGRPTESTNLADILERVLDKGIVIAGDIQINLLDLELLTIKLRLLIASVDRAREMGINWWETDPSLQAMEQGDNGRDELERENRELRERLERLEQRLGLEQGEGREESSDEEQGQRSQERGQGRQESGRAG
jgi:Gas vesicle protein